MQWASYVNLSTKTEILLPTLALNIYLGLTSHNFHPYYLTTSHPKSEFSFLVCNIQKLIMLVPSPVRFGSDTSCDGTAKLKL